MRIKAWVVRTAACVVMVLGASSAMGQAAGGSAPPPPDGGRLQALLKAGDFERLDAEMTAYQDAYRAGAIDDSAAAEAFVVLVDRDPDMRAAYDSWVAVRPQSYVARVARGYYFMKMGYLARGSEYASKTPQAQFDAMRAYFNAAREDLELSLKLDAKPSLSYGTLIAIAEGPGARELRERYLDQAVALDPRIWTARVTYFRDLKPEWGGSHDQMENAIKVWSGSLTEKQAALLRDSLEDSRWRTRLEPIADLVRTRQYPQAIAEYSKVLEKTPVLRAYAMRGASYAGLGQLDKAIDDFNRVIELDPGGGCCSGARSNRASAYLKSGKKEQGLADLVYAAERDDAWAAGQLARIYAFGQYGFKTDYAQARRWCERAAKQGDGLAMYCLGGLYHAGQGAPKDMAFAAYWFAEAGQRGVGDGAADVGIMYWNGTGVSQDRDVAARWWRLAASQGNKRAAAKLLDNGFYWSYVRYAVLPEWIGDGRKK
jgi:TPR repeat protein